MGGGAAGDFRAWLAGIERALEGGDSDVPCGDCSACCTSSQFVHIGADEMDTLAHIPGDLLFPAPGATDGTVLLGYDERGHCPLLEDGRCSIYEHRPRTCRVYDCRVFAAAGVEPDKPDISATVQSWRFDDAASPEREAIGRAARWLDGHREELIVTGAVSDPTRVAVSAIRVWRLFRDGVPDVDQVAASLRPD